MKQLCRILAAFTALCLLCGCGILRNEHTSVEEHRDPYAYKEEPEPTETEPEETEPELQSASNYYAVLSILRAFVTSGVEHGQFLLSDYRGSVEEELPEAFHALKSEDPLGAYAIDYIEYERTQTDSGWLITVDTVYRRTLGEIEAIQPVRGNERAMQLIRSTLEQLGTSITLQISGYQEQDFIEQIRCYCREHPNVIVRMPQIALSVYPDEGNVRVAELHLSYGADRETLRSMQSEAESVLSSAEGYARYAQDEKAKLELIYSYLTSRFSYAEDEQNGSVYGLLCEGVGNSESFASITAYLAGRLGLSCSIVDGTRVRSVQTEEGETEEAAVPYVWNVVWIDGICYHVDLQEDALRAAEEPRLRLDADMQGYEWDTENVPVCNDELPEPEPEPEATEP